MGKLPFNELTANVSCGIHDQLPFQRVRRKTKTQKWRRRNKEKRATPPRRYWGKQSEPCESKYSRLSQRKCCVFRTVMMRTRRWGTCSWPGRCWNLPRSFTKGISCEATGLFLNVALLLFHLFFLSCFFSS